MFEQMVHSRSESENFRSGVVITCQHNSHVSLLFGFGSVPTVIRRQGGEYGSQWVLPQTVGMLQNTGEKDAYWSAPSCRRTEGSNGFAQEG